MNLESDRVERKASVADKDKICEAICAFANDLPNHEMPGVIFVGVSDDGTCGGVAVTDQLLLSLSSIRSDGNILPFPMMTVQKKVLRQCELAVIEVQPSYSPPVRYKQRVCIRVGPRRAYATADEERRLTEKRRSGDLTFDQRPVAGATVEDLDIELFRRNYLPSVVSEEVLKENERSVEEQLAAVRFLARNSEPTVSAILTLGKDVRRWIPGAYIQFLRLDGDELLDPIVHQKEISGPLPELLLQLDEVLDANISVSAEVTAGPIERQRPDYPIVALQQLARNAVLHRTYESTNAPVRIYWFRDRIEIHSPGGPYGAVNERNFGQPGVTDYRNPQLAEVMKSLGFVQRFGLGIALARRELAKNESPALEFNVQPSAVLAIVRRAA